MSIHRHAANVDKSQQPIIAAILEEGWEVWVMRVPCDLLCWHPVLDVWQPMEVKNPKRCTKGGESWDRNAQVSQRKFLAWTDVPIVTTEQQALEALRKHYPATVVPEQLAAWSAQLKQRFEREWKCQPTAAPSARAMVELGVVPPAKPQLFPT